MTAAQPYQCSDYASVSPARVEGCKRILVISFSPIAQDARVLKQVRLLSQSYQVTTCGFGPAPEGIERHIQIHHRCLPGKTWDALLQLRAYLAGYWLMPDVRSAWKQLRGLDCDAVLADDIDTLPVALRLKPRGGVHSDLHEFFPCLHEEHAPWKKRIGPWYAWMVKRYVPQAVSVTTVSQGIAHAYATMSGRSVGVVTNATPYQDLTPSAVGTPIRVVHSGTSHRERNLDALIDGVLAVSGFTLDLFLTPNDPAYLAQLKQRAQGEPRLSVHDAVPYDRLIATLNQFDLGVHLLPPKNFNFAHALPNKIFDFVQARLGVIVGPSPEMARLVRDTGCAVVTSGYQGDDLAAALRGISVEEVERMKQASHTHARELSADSQLPIWGEVIATILRKADGVPRTDRDTGALAEPDERLRRVGDDHE